MFFALDHKTDIVVAGGSLEQQSIFAGNPDNIGQSRNGREHIVARVSERVVAQLGG
jgi:hypothetical protein